MTYYGGGGGGSSCENLLSTGNGICGAWSKFLIDCFRAQGIDAEWMLIHPKAPPDADLEAALSAAHGGTWAGDAGPEKFLYVREWNTTNVFGPLPETGIQGQGNEDPPAKFSDHAFVRYASMLYDPSYGGQTYSSLMAWENASLKAIGARYTATGSGGTSAAGEWIWKNNIPTAEETTMTLSAYPIAP